VKMKPGQDQERDSPSAQASKGSSGWCVRHLERDEQSRNECERDRASQQRQHKAYRGLNNPGLQHAGEHPAGSGDPDWSKGVPPGLLHLEQTAAGVRQPQLVRVQEPLFLLGAPLTNVTWYWKLEKKELQLSIAGLS
jgi:hypothetical protein